MKRLSDWTTDELKLYLRDHKGVRSTRQMTTCRRIQDELARREETWQVWSKSPRGDAWMVIDSGTEQQCKEGAERRIANAKRLGFEAEFRALPRGEKPS